jgi:hypothetical protein
MHPGQFARELHANLRQVRKVERCQDVPKERHEECQRGALR